MRIFDSNILIYYLNGLLPDQSHALVESWIDENAYISIITRIEVLGFRQVEQSFKQAERLLSLFELVPLHNNIVERAIAVRRTVSSKLPDAVIAATALELDMPLVSRNIRDFRAITGLMLLNPFETPRIG